MDEIDDGEDVFSFSAWNTFAIREKFAAFVVDVVPVLNGRAGTNSKGLNASPGVCVELKKRLFLRRYCIKYNN